MQADDAPFNIKSGNLGPNRIVWHHARQMQSSKSPFGGWTVYKTATNPYPTALCTWRHSKITHRLRLELGGIALAASVGYRGLFQGHARHCLKCPCSGIRKRLLVLSEVI
jgi:hypothetical protein